MSKLVLDANVALRFVLNEEHSDKARKLIDEYRRGIHELLAPNYFPVEVANALTRAERRRAIPPGQASVLLDDIMAHCPALHDALPLLARATDLSSRSRASIYDCLYLTLAEDCDCEFVTADRKILNSFPANTRILELSQL